MFFRRTSVWDRDYSILQTLVRSAIRGGNELSKVKNQKTEIVDGKHFLTCRAVTFILPTSRLKFLAPVFRSDPVVALLLYLIRLATRGRLENDRTRHRLLEAMA